MGVVVKKKKKKHCLWRTGRSRFHNTVITNQNPHYTVSTNHEYFTVFSERDRLMDRVCIAQIGGDKTKQKQVLEARTYRYTCKANKFHVRSDKETFLLWK